MFASYFTGVRMAERYLEGSSPRQPVRRFSEPAACLTPQVQNISHTSKGKIDHLRRSWDT